MPVGNWDHLSERGEVNQFGQFVSDRRWPLYTLWSDEDNWIEFSADCMAGGNKGFLLRVNKNGTISTYEFGNAGQRWMQGSPLLVAYSFLEIAPGTRKLFVRASLGAEFPLALNDVPLPSGTDYTELRFRGATGGHSNQGEVCEFRWFGGQIDEENPLAGETLESPFTNLAFLDGP
jgi:hypothetical protein